jgi:hypothetical protein
MANTKEPTELTDLEVDEVSLVKQGANGRRFRILKAGGAPGDYMEELSDILKSDMGIEDQTRDLIEKKAPELSPDAAEAMVGVVKLAQTYAEQLPSDIFDTLAEASGFEKAVKKQPLPADGKTPDKPDDEDDEDDDKDQEDDAPQNKKAKKMAKKADKGAVEKALEKIEKEEDIDLLPEDIQKAVRPLWKHNVELAEKIEKMEDERLTKEFIAKAAEFTRLPKTPEFATVLKSMSQKLDADEFAVVEGVFKASEEALKESGLFAEVGSTIAVAGTPQGKLEAMAKERLTKSDGKLTYEQAMADVTMEHPEIYEEMTRNRQ